MGMRLSRKRSCWTCFRRRRPLQFRRSHKQSPAVSASLTKRLGSRWFSTKVHSSTSSAVKTCYWTSMPPNSSAKIGELTFWPLNQSKDTSKLFRDLTTFVVRETRSWYGMVKTCFSSTKQSQHQPCTSTSRSQSTKRANACSFRRLKRNYRLRGATLRKNLYVVSWSLSQTIFKNRSSWWEESLDQGKVLPGCLLSS